MGKLEDQLKRAWKKYRYYLTLQWIHPFWLRAVISLLIALPLFILFVIGTATALLFGPLLVLSIIFGFSWAFVLWILLNIFVIVQLRKWHTRYNRTRPRRRVRRNTL